MTNKSCFPSGQTSVWDVLLVFGFHAKVLTKFLDCVWMVGPQGIKCEYICPEIVVESACQILIDWHLLAC